MDHIDPYKMPAGPELDAAIHEFLRDGSLEPVCPEYSSDMAEAAKVKSWLETQYGLQVVTGRTRISGKPWFARYETDPSTGTEVIAESCPLAICRLALVRVSRDTD